MPLQIIRHDITKVECDAIVNAANPSLMGGGGVDGAIHAAAGSGLLAECATLGGCSVGDAKITGGYNLPCKYVIHTVGPVWHGGDYGEKEKLISCYRSSLALAKEYGCKSVAFPLISSGIYGYPKDKALGVAIETIAEFLMENEMLVYIVVFDKAGFSIGKKLFSDIEEYIDENYVDKFADTRRSFPASACRTSAFIDDDGCPEESAFGIDKALGGGVPFSEDETDDISQLESIFKSIDESFSQMLLRKIDEKGMTDIQCYKKANIDRKLFSKIRSDVNYKPKKQTAIAFAIALELSLEETEEMLKKAGYSLSRSNRFDIIIEYFITKGIYNIFIINEALFAFDQNLLG